MNIQKAISLIPSGWPHSVQKAADKKIICEDLVQEIINQILNENRNPTKWEIDGLSQAVKAIRFGNYVQASNEAMSIFLTQKEVSKSRDLWLPVIDDLTLEKLNRDLAQLKGEPPRVDY